MATIVAGMYLPTILFVIAGWCKAISDSIAHRNGLAKYGQWWSQDSWKNKWRDGNPAAGERFPGSSTVLVWVTDAWHFFNAVQVVCYAASVYFAYPFHGFVGVLYAAGLIGLRAASFHILYYYIKQSVY